MRIKKKLAFLLTVVILEVLCSPLFGLSTTWQEKISETLHQPTTNLYFSKTENGVDNDVYFVFVKKNHSIVAVLKIYTKKDVEMVLYLQQILQQIRKRGGKSPEILDVFSVEGKAGVLYKYYKGEHPTNLSNAQIETIAKEMAFLHQLQNVSADVKESISIEDLLQLLEKCPGHPASEWLKHVLSTIDVAYIKWIPRGFVHGDFSKSNLIFNDNEIKAILDFDHCALTDLLTDIVRSQIFFAFDDDGNFLLDKCNLFIHAYEKYRMLTKDEREGFYTHLLLQLIKMQLLTYYYVEIKKEVLIELFTGNRKSQSPNALLKIINNFLTCMNKEIIKCH